MNLREIVFRPDNQPIEQDEALFVLAAYIRVRTGVEAKPYVTADEGVKTLAIFARIATTWFRQNPQAI